jgi:hypothetical protein
VTVPTPVTPVDAEPDSVTDRLEGPRVPVDDALLARLRDCCAEVSTGDEDLTEAGPRLVAYRNPVGDEGRGGAAAGRSRTTYFNATGRGRAGVLQQRPAFRCPPRAADPVCADRACRCSEGLRST